MGTPTTSFEVHVAKEDFKFHVAHFVAFKGYRERLHGHNYKVGVRLMGSRKIANDGYVVDFGNIKMVTRKICKELNEHFICPMLSDVIQIQVQGDPGSETVHLKCEDGSSFTFPKDDCSLLPIVHSTAEELAVYMWSRIMEGLNAGWLAQRGIHTMEVIVTEAIGQEASFRRQVPSDEVNSVPLDVRSFILDGEVAPMPCATADIAPAEKGACPEVKCSCHQAFLAKLQHLADSINSNTTNSKITPEDIMAIVNESA